MARRMKHAENPMSEKARSHPRMPTHRARRGRRRHRSRPRDRRTEQHVHQSNADERISPEGQNRRRREVSAENPSLRPRRVLLKTYHGHPLHGRRINVAGKKNVAGHNAESLPM